ncbi:TPA: hypothetical protein ACM5I7_005231, partial [Escherichia coli]
NVSFRSTERQTPITREDLLVAATLLAQNLFTHGYALGKL